MTNLIAKGFRCEIRFKLWSLQYNLPYSSIYYQPTFRKEYQRKHNFTFLLPYHHH